LRTIFLGWPSTMAFWISVFQAARIIDIRHQGQAQLVNIKTVIVI
jgi:hypothetical protein